jgi:hypothetical protein
MWRLRRCALERAHALLFVSSVKPSVGDGIYGVRRWDHRWAILGGRGGRLVVELLEGQFDAKLTHHGKDELHEDLTVATLQIEHAVTAHVWLGRQLRLREASVLSSLPEKSAQLARVSNDHGCGANVRFIAHYKMFESANISRCSFWRTFGGGQLRQSYGAKWKRRFTTTNRRSSLHCRITPGGFEARSFLLWLQCRRLKQMLVHVAIVFPVAATRQAPVVVRPAFWLFAP